MTTEVLGRRTLNQVLLERQMLPRCSRLSAFEADEHLVGMQSQVPDAPYVGLRTRLEGFRPRTELLRRSDETRASISASTAGPLARRTKHFESSVGFIGSERLFWEHHDPEMEQLAGMRKWLDNVERKLS